MRMDSQTGRSVPYNASGLEMKHGLVYYSGNSHNTNIQSNKKQHQMFAKH